MESYHSTANHYLYILVQYDCLRIYVNGTMNNTMGIIFTFWPQIQKLKMFPLYYCHLPVYHTFVSLLCQNSNIVQETNAKHICQAHKLINIYHIVFTVSSLTSALYNVIAFFVIFLSLCIMYVCYRLFVHFIQYTHVML